MLRLPLRDLFVRVGPWSRRELRRLQGQVEGPSGPLPLSAPVTLEGEWTPFRFRGIEVEARASLPPLALLDKPVGFVTSRTPDGGAPTVFELLDGSVRDRVQPVGRLDRESSGLLLLTAHGPLIQRLTHPKRQVSRSYVATVEGEPDPRILEAARRGELALRDGHHPHPRVLESLGGGRWRVELLEGKYHEVRRLFGAAGARVTELRRTAHGGFTLDDLGGRRFRRLEEDEVAGLYRELELPLSDLEAEVRVVAGPEDVPVGEARDVPPPG